MNNSLAKVHPELVSEWSEKNLTLMASLIRPIPLMAVHMCRKIVMCRNLQTTSLYTDTI